jgi:hypothetical protein
LTADPNLQALLDSQRQQQSQDKTTRPLRRYIRGALALSNALQTIITCPALTYARVDAIAVNNPSAGTLLLTLNVIPAGGSAATTNELTSVLSFGSHVGSGTVLVPVGVVLGPGDVIQGKGDSAGLNVWISAEVVEPGPGQ